MNNKNKIFVFGLYTQTIPPYLNLCLKTWRKNLPDGYEIIFLNENNIYDYIPAKFLPLMHTESNCILRAYFYEYISAAVLYYNGGIFLDRDVIITEKFLPPDILLSRYNLVLYGNSAFDICHGFMMANQYCPLLKELMNRLVLLLKNPAPRNFKKNEVLKNVLKDYLLQDTLVLDAEETGYCMEKAMYGVFSSYLYNRYYFTDIGNVEDFCNVTKGITALNDSFSPEKYRQMSEKEFLNQEILLAKIFKVIL